MRVINGKELEPMSGNANIDLIKNIYASFGRGDIDSIIAVLKDDVQWEQPEHPDIPYGGSRKGKAAVREFFKAVGQVDVISFEPLDYVADGDRVLAIGRWKGRVRATGKTFLSEWVMSWIVRNGKVTQFRAYEDTAALVAAFRK
jgi:ketosteroid isomerase-like protein